MTDTLIQVYGGKYTVVLRSDGSSTALRHSELWPAFAGVTQLDNLTVALARDLEEARDLVRRLDEHEGAEGWSADLQADIKEYWRKYPSPQSPTESSRSTDVAAPGSVASSGWLGCNEDPPLIKANDPILKLRGRPVPTDVRILSEENYQLAVKALTTMLLVEELRADECDSIMLLCDNPDGPPNNAVETSGVWTNHQDRRFGGETLIEALTKALDAKKAAQADETAEIARSLTRRCECGNPMGPAYSKCGICRG